MRQTKVLGYVTGFLAVAIWSSVYSLKAVMLEYIGPLEIVFLQYLGTTVLLGLLVHLSRRRLNVGWRAARTMLASGATCVALFQVLVTVGIGMVGSIMSSIFSGILPAMCILIDVVVLRKRWCVLGWLGILCSFMGILLVVGGTPLGSEHLLGCLVMLGSNVVWICYCYFNHKLQGKQDSMVLLFYQSLGALLVLMPIAAAGQFRCLAVMADPRLTLQVLFLAAVNGVAAYLLLNFTIQTLDVVVSNIIFNFVPVCTIFLEWMVYGRGLKPIQLLGTALVILSAVLPNIQTGSHEKIN